jgi:dipeptidyl aminopeptidase/acylaminoacyl peptidase
MNPLKSVLLIVALTCAAALVLAQDRSQAQQFQEAITMMETKGNYTAAIRLFEQAAKGPDRTLAARALYYAGQCYEKSGKDKAQQAYQRLIKQFAEQRQVVAEARARLSALSPAAGNVAADKATGGMSVRQVYGGSDTSGAWMVSPDGRYLAFTDWGVGDLAIRDLVTQQIRKLTKNPPDSSEGVDVSVWSPDGKWIAYGCWWEDNNKVDRWDLRLIGVDGSGRRVLHRLDPESRNMEPYGWSPDGRNILVNISRKDRSNQIAWVTVKDGSIRVLKTVDNHGYDLDLSLSPDGRYILYNLRQSKIGERDIILLASDGSYERPLVEHPADDYVLGWLPDATKVLFASNRTSTTSAWVIAVPNGKPQGAPELVKPDIGARSSSLGITRSGSFYYKFNSGMVDVYVATLDPITGKVVTAPTQISQRFVGSNAQPSGAFLKFYSWFRPEEVVLCKST